MFKQSNDRSSETGERSDSLDPAISQKLPEKSTYKRQYPLSAFNNFGVRIFGYYKTKSTMELKVFYTLYTRGNIAKVESNTLPHFIIFFYSEFPTFLRLGIFQP